MTDSPTPPAYTEPPVANSEIEASPASPSRRRWLLPVAIVTGAAVVIAGGIALYGAITSPNSPTGVATSYLDALVAGNADDALSYVDGLGKGDRVLLSDEVYEKATERVSAFEITGETIDDTTATVTASVTVGGKTTEHKLALSKSDDGGWAVNAANLPRVTVSFVRPEGFTTAVNGVDLGETSISKAAAFPGTYEFQPMAPSDLFEAEPVTQSVPFEGKDEPSTVELSAQLSESGLAAAQAAFTKHLDGCLASTGLVPKACGYGMNTDANTTYSKIRWSAPKRPVVGFAAWNDDKGWEATLVSSGHIRLDGDYTDERGTGPVYLNYTRYKPAGGVLFDKDGTATYVSTYVD